MDLLANAQPQWLLAGTALLLATVAFLKVLLDSGGNGKQVPPMIPGAPAVGGLLRFLRGPILLILAEYTRLGPVFTVAILTRRFTFLIDPDVSAHFFKSNESDMSQQEVHRNYPDLPGNPDRRSDSPSDEVMLLPPINYLDIDFTMEAQDRPTARLPE